jgi:hypothetical protein
VYAPAPGLLPAADTPWPDDPIFREALLEALGRGVLENSH